MGMLSNSCTHILPAWFYQPCGTTQHEHEVFEDFTPRSLNLCMLNALTVDECFLLGRLSYNDKDLYHTILWMQEALDIDRAAPYNPGNRTAVERKEILDYLSYALAVVSWRGVIFLTHAETVMMFLNK